MSKPIKIVLTNHKGGVGKTILTANIAHALGQLGKKVLLVDSDPQCNLTAYIIDDKVVDKLLDESEGENGKTIWTSLKPIVDAEGDVKIIKPTETFMTNVFLLPGDIRLSEYEEALVSFWTECFQRRAKGFRGVSALSKLSSICSANIMADYVLYDSGPNIGPINRAVFLDCDYFIVPTACDLFSLRGFKTLGRTLKKWKDEWAIIDHFTPKEFKTFSGEPSFLGYIPQRFRVYSGKMSSASLEFMPRLERGLFNDIFKVLTPKSKKTQMLKTNLGEVKEVTTLVQKALLAGTPLSETPDSNKEERRLVADSFNKIAKKIIKLTMK